MGFTQALRAVGGAVLAGALVMSAAPAASANDGARAAEWPLTEYGATKDVWTHSTGKGVTVAVIDSGVRATHVDLTGQVLQGTDYVHGGNGQTDYAADGHGTGLASLIAGHGHGSNGDDGIMGLAPGAKILPVGVGTDADHAKDHTSLAIRYAVDHGASVINMSFGSVYSKSDDVQAAVAYAEAHNVVLVAAAGNSGMEEDDYPASYPGVISVGAVDQNASLWGRSAYGSHLTVVAPGVGIVRDGSGSDAQMYKDDGTSYATAYVSAIATLIRSAYPHLTQGQVVNYIIKGAKLPAGVAQHDPHWGYGIARPNQFDKWATMDPGPAAGPLPQATGAAAAAPTQGGTQPATGLASGSAKSSSGTIVFAAVGGVVLIVLLVVIVLIVWRKNKNTRGPGGPTGPGGYAPQPPLGAGAQGQAYQPPYQPQQPFQQQPYQPPYQQPQQSVYQNNPYAQPPQPPQPPYGGGNPQG
ncbi:type VII secretion-associated serine protease mycosin [Streptacidiphilus sp. MAP12-16]|uniref:S8 family serine peptidase n=1 Tax=Streptacidiphilus sp. MAP12-16 TaxID=3156300 RepID=UPI0035195286